MRWQLQDAKNRFSQVVDLARTEGPQTITLRGKEAAVVISIEDYRRLTRPQPRLSDFLRASPLAGQDLDLTRHDDDGRDVDLRGICWIPASSRKPGVQSLTIRSCNGWMGGTRTTSF